MSFGERKGIIERMGVKEVKKQARNEIKKGRKDQFALFLVIVWFCYKEIVCTSIQCHCDDRVYVYVCEPLKRSTPFPYNQRNLTISVTGKHCDLRCFFILGA